jgi:predicted nuclease of predicted toxin-antitoxin system
VLGLRGRAGAPIACASGSVVTARLLLDENLSERLLHPLADLFPGSEHVRNLRRSGASDRAVWELAGTGGFVLATRDEDFVGMSVLRGTPPNVVWLNVGNSRNAVVAALLRSHAADIERFVAHEEYTFLAIGFYKAPSIR